MRAPPTRTWQALLLADVTLFLFLCISPDLALGQTPPPTPPPSVTPPPTVAAQVPPTGAPGGDGPATTPAPFSFNYTFVPYEDEAERNTVPVVIVVIVSFLVVMGILLYYYYYQRRERQSNLMREQELEQTSLAPLGDVSGISPGSTTSPAPALPSEPPATPQHGRMTPRGGDSISLQMAPVLPPQRQAAQRRSSSVVHPNATRFAVGDRVVSISQKGRRPAPGIVTGVDPALRRYSVQFDDGSQAVSHEEATLREGRPRYAVGARVSVFDPATGQSTAGHIESAQRSGALYAVRLGSSVKLGIPEARLIPARRFNEGDQVYMGLAPREGAVVADVHDDGTYTLLIGPDLAVEKAVPDVSLEHRQDIEFEVGSSVFARRDGPDSLAAAGFVTDVVIPHKRYTVLFDDGLASEVDARWILPRCTEDTGDPLDDDSPALRPSVSFGENTSLVPPPPHKRRSGRASDFGLPVGPARHTGSSPRSSLSPAASMHSMSSSVHRGSVASSSNPLRSSRARTSFAYTNL